MKEHCFDYAAATVFALMVCCLIAREAQAKGLPACTSNITACGCAITTPGIYNVKNNLTTASKTEDCIDIAAPNVSLLNNGFTITGAGAGSTNVGINVLKNAKGAGFGDTTISKFGTGIEIAAANVVVGDLEVTANIGNGLAINSTSGTSVFNFGSLDNGGIGILINKGSNLELDDFSSTGNGGGGLSLVGSKGVKISDFNTGNTFLSEPGDNGNFGISLNKSSGNSLSDFDSSENPTDGIVLNASKGNFLGSFDALQNGRNGVTLIHSSGNQISDGSSNDNGNYGFWLQGSSNNLVNFQDALGNTQTGVYVGCAADGGPTGPRVRECLPATATASSTSMSVPTR